MKKLIGKIACLLGIHSIEPTKVLWSGYKCKCTNCNRNFFYSITAGLVDDNDINNEA